MFFVLVMEIKLVNNLNNKVIGDFIMKTLTITLIVILSFVVAGVFNSLAGEKNKKVSASDSYSKNLINALQSPNDGLRKSALQMIIHDADRVNVDKAAFEVVDLYRYHKDLKVQMLHLIYVQHY